jgi:predicted nucleic acid-binding protein
MADKTFVMDTSALMAFIEKEDGAERVRDVLTQYSIIIPWIVILEVVYITQRELGEEEAMTRYALLKQLKAKIIWEADEASLITSARFKAENKVSLADSIIAASAVLNQATLIHKDPEYEALKGQVEMEALPYK